jgi:hypothetical protein
MVVLQISKGGHVNRRTVGKAGKDNGMWCVSGVNSVVALPLPTKGFEIKILLKTLFITNCS